MQLTKAEFEQGIVEMVAYEAIPLCLFQSDCFQKINKQLADRLGVSLTYETVRALVIAAANNAKDVLKKLLVGKFVHVKTDGCTRHSVNYIGTNLQFFESDKVRIGYRCWRPIGRVKATCSRGRDKGYCRSSVLFVI